MLNAGAAGSNQPNGEIKHGLPQPGIKRNRSEEPQQPQWQGGQSQEPSLGEEHRVKKKKQALEVMHSCQASNSGLVKRVSSGYQSIALYSLQDRLQQSPVSAATTGLKLRSSHHIVITNTGDDEFCTLML